MRSRASRPVTLLVAAFMLNGCAEGAVPLIASVPESARPAPPAVYPNINENPERPPTTRSQGEVEGLERELEQLRESHVGGTRSRIEGSQRGS